MANKETEPKEEREILLSEEQIHVRLSEIAKEISTKYQGKKLLLVGVLNGAYIVMADLGRALHKAGLDDVEIDFVQISSYGEGTESSRNPRLLKDCGIDISNRHVMIVEDIVETGYSLAALQALFVARGVSSLETFCLLSKSQKREIEVSVNYIGFEVNDWVEGFGLDSNQYGRVNPQIVKVTQKSSS